VGAYELLLSEGYVTARRGSGTVVAALLAHTPSGHVLKGPRQYGRRLHRHWRGRLLPPQSAPEVSPSYDFQVGVPYTAGFPYGMWRRFSGRIDRRLRDGRLRSTDPQGMAELRTAIAGHVSYSRAVACDPDDIVVTAGAQQAFDLLARILTTPGRSTVAIENPGYPPVAAAFSACGARLARIPVDEEGLQVDRIPARARVVCVTPSHQFPLGAVMPTYRRSALIERCAQQGTVVIEDDYDSEFRFSDRPLDALQTLDRAQSVFYVGTFSKSLLPELRLGYIVAPRWALPALVAAKQIADGYSSPLTQATVALLIREGYLARHIRKMQRIYARRRAQMIDGLQSACGSWLELVPSVAGLHVAARLTSAHTEARVIARALAAGVAVKSLSAYYSAPPSVPGLLFGYGNISEAALVEGIKRLAACVANL
jgi:GntR family transcriptional regulator / MocR family aminotransferase